MSSVGVPRDRNGGAFTKMIQCILPLPPEDNHGGSNTKALTLISAPATKSCHATSKVAQDLILIRFLRNRALTVPLRHISIAERES